MSHPPVPPQSAGLLSGIFNRLAERILFILCRHCVDWRGMWRLDLRRRVREFRFPEPGTLVTRTEFGFSIEVRKNDVIGNDLHFFGHHNRQLEAVARAELAPGDCALDLGANLGAVTVLLAQLVGPSGRVFAVEPLAGTFAILQRNLARTGFDRVVCAEPCAAGRAATTATLFFDAETSNWGGVSLQSESGSGSEEIRIEPLDELWKRWGRPQFRFVKMDVEGSELDVLAAATEMLAEAPPRAWLVEFNKEHLDRIPDGTGRLWSAFISRGYCAFDKAGTLLQHPPEEHADVLFRLNA